MSSEPDVAAVEKLKIREEALRRKEKEVAKKEEQMKEQLDQIRSMRAAMDATMQELEARELVMTDAETKHGSLLQREEAITRRERDVDTKEETLRERLIEATKREQEAAEFFKQRQREYEEKLFPLAAREQELVRREMEAQAMDHDLEIKYKQLNKHVASEEEKEKVRDKSFRDREQTLRDQMALTDRRQQELDQLNLHLTEKQRLLKAENVENDGRDREIKWREEQMRVAQAEMTELKTKLIKWEGKLTVDDESNRVEQARVAMMLAELSLRETDMAEKTSKLLAMDEEIQRREQLSQTTMKEVNCAMEQSERAKSEVEAAKQQALEQLRTLAEREEAIREKETRLNDTDAKQRVQAKVIDEKEKSIKGWIMELQYREQQSGTTHATTSFQAQELSNTPLEALQDCYITMMGAATGAGNGKKGGTPPPPHSSRLLLQPLSAGNPLGNVANAGGVGTSAANLGECADTVALEVRRVQLEESVDAYMVLLYAMSDDERRSLLSAAEEAQMRAAESRNRELVSELQFLWQVLVGKHQRKTAITASSAKLAKELASFGYQFSAADWAAYYQAVRSEAVKRRNDVIAESIARLTELVELLQRRVGTDALASARTLREELKNTSGVSRIKHMELGKLLSAGRATNATAVLAPLLSPKGGSGPSSAHRTASVDSGDGDGSESGAQSTTPTTAQVSAATASKAPKSKANKPSTKAQEIRAQLTASLPDYLRHHYED